MPMSDERIADLCREIADQLRASAADAEADLTLEERRALIDIALGDRSTAADRPKA